MESKNIVIFGAGGLGREVLFLLLTENKITYQYNILGFVDDTPDLQGKLVNNYPVLGTVDWLMKYPDKINAVVCIGDSCARKKVVEKIATNKNICFPTIIASDTKYSETVQFGKGCIIGFSSIFTVNISLGDFVIVNPCCVIGHDAVIGDYVTLYGSVSINGYVSIGSGVEVGAGARIIPKKSIGENSKVGIGSVVVGNVLPNCTVFGNPAKILVPSVGQ
jgi:sugar O-acyltransferase (sialic acid O-acetyltransferase NeuD family)